MSTSFHLFIALHAVSEVQQWRLGNGGMENYFFRASEDESGLCTTSQSLCAVRVFISPLSPQEQNSHSVSVSVNQQKIVQSLTDVSKIYTSISDQLVALLTVHPENFVLIHNVAGLLFQSMYGKYPIQEKV